MAHWLYLLLLSTRHSAAGNVIKRPIWWLANAGIVILFLPWLPGLVDLLQHMHELKSRWRCRLGAACRCSLPAMVWQLLTQDEGDTLPWPVFWLAPLALFAGVI